MYFTGTFRLSLTVHKLFHDFLLAGNSQKRPKLGVSGDFGPLRCFDSKAGTPQNALTCARPRLLSRERPSRLTRAVCAGSQMKVR